MRSRPFPLVIAAPSGAGKTSIARALVERGRGVSFSVSATTRARRPHEAQGEAYHFVEDAEFARMIEAGELVEWAEVHGRRYGTPKRGITEALERGDVVVLDIDVQGARQIRAAFADAVLVFVLPPSAAELRRRLEGRGSERGDERRRRLRNARAELGAAVEFDYIVVNEQLEAAVDQLERIIAVERSRVARLEGLPAHIGALDRQLAEILERSE